jgi:hypothetical protein
MTCEEFDAIVEPLAAGELEPSPAAAEHLAGCLRCAAAVALARRIDSALAAVETPAPPPRFGAAVASRLRRDRWRAEQRVDRVFNLTLAFAAVLVTVGVAMLFNLSGLAAVARETSGLLAEGLRVATGQMAAQLPSYAVGTSLLLTAVGAWWWAERAR